MDESDVGEISEKAENAREALDELLDAAKEKQDSLESEVGDLKDAIRKHVDISELDEDVLEDFFDQPYAMVPRAEKEAWVIVPRWVPFNVGRLHKQDKSYNYYVVNKYIDWIGELPDEIRGKVGIDKKFEGVSVEDNMLKVDNPDEQEQVWDTLGGQDGGLYRRKDNDKIQIKKGKEFDVISKLIEEGNLPFTPHSVEEEYLRSPPPNLDLRSYQERAWDKLKDTGMIGVYWPPGAGKTFLALYAGDMIEGQKLVIVPSKTLEEQWENRIDEFCRYPTEWEVKTYQYFSYKNNLQEYQEDKGQTALTVYDECHRLPANTFSRISTINTKYRIGLSASPYREDGKTQYIFALTGYPVGLEWDELVDLGVVQQPDIHVYLYNTQNKKRKDVSTLVNERTGKILVFSDSLDKGETLSNELDVPFIHGGTTDRIEKFKNNRVVVSSRVGDEGLSIEDIDSVIEFDFHGASRRQEIQRMGRLMHGPGGEHIVMMTDEEMEKFGERLYSIEQKGFNIQYTRRS